MSLPYNLYGTGPPLNPAYYQQNQQHGRIPPQPGANQDQSLVQPPQTGINNHNPTQQFGASAGPSGYDNDNRRLNPLPGIHHNVMEGDHMMNLQGVGMKYLPKQPAEQGSSLPAIQPPIQRLANVEMPPTNMSGNPPYQVYPGNNPYLGPIQAAYPPYVGPYLNKSYENDGQSHVPVHLPPQIILQLQQSHFQSQLPQHMQSPPGHIPLPPHALGQMPPQVQPQGQSQVTSQILSQTPSQVQSETNSPMPGSYNAVSGQNQSPPASAGSAYTSLGSYSTPVATDGNLSKDIRTRTNYAETYKPTRPKKNSKPKIKKLNKTMAIKKDLLKAKMVEDTYCEIPSDPFFIHFQISLKINRNDMKLNVPPFLKVNSGLEKKLFDLFIHQVSRCMDMFMLHDFFADIVPKMALLDDTGMILSSMNSLSALMLQRIDPNSIDLSIPINYYHQTIRSIRHYLSLPSTSEDNDGIIARCLLSTILLGVYEMFFLASDNTYVKGAVSLLTSIISKTQDGSPLKNSPFLQMCFWAMFVCDLILSLKFNLPAMFSVKQFWRQIDPQFIDQFSRPYNKISEPTTKEGEHNSSLLFISRKDSCWWLHKALLDFSMVHEFNTEVVVLNNEEFENNKLFHDWLALNKQIDEFEENMPVALKPIIYKPSSADSTYPSIFFRDELSALVTLQFKLSKISLYQALIQKTNLESAEVQEYLGSIPRNHAKLLAKDVIGILKTYDLNIYLWPINIHTIRQVARYLHDDELEYKELEQLMERVIKTCHFIFQSKGIIG